MTQSFCQLEKTKKGKVKKMRLEVMGCEIKHQICVELSYDNDDFEFDVNKLFLWNNENENAMDVAVKNSMVEASKYINLKDDCDDVFATAYLDERDGKLFVDFSVSFYDEHEKMYEYNGVFYVERPYKDLENVTKFLLKNKFTRKADIVQGYHERSQSQELKCVFYSKEDLEYDITIHKNKNGSWSYYTPTSMWGFELTEKELLKELSLFHYKILGKFVK